MPVPRFQDPAFALGFARIVTHFWRHGSWLEEGVVLAEASRLAGIPAVLVQGNLDLGNLIGTPWKLAAAWPDSELVLVNAGHHATGALGAAIVWATDRFRSLDPAGRPRLRS